MCLTMSTSTVGKIHRKNTSSLIDRLILGFGFTLIILVSFVPMIQSKPICYGDVDLVFVVDASYSIADPDFTKVCDFLVAQYSAVYETTGEKLHAGVIFYASSVYEDPNIIHLTDDQGLVVPRLKTFKRNVRNVNTNTAAGLKRAKVMFDGEGRDKASKIAVLVTDGKSDNPAATQLAASELKQAGVTLIAVGVGSSDRVDLAELKAIASVPENGFLKDDVNEAGFSELVTKMICMATLGNKKPPEVKRDSLPMDVYFLLDESSAVLSNDFEISRELIKTIMRSFTISINHARVGILKYGRASLDVPHVIPIGSWNTETTLFTAIDGLRLNPLNSGGRDLAGTFRRLEGYLNTSSTDEGRPVIMVLLTAGISGNTAAAVRMAEAFKRRRDPKVYMLVIGVGKDSDAWLSERTQLAYSDVTSFHTADFTGLAGNEQTSVDRIATIRNVIYRIGSKTFETSGPGALDRWDVPFDIIFVVDGSKQVRASPEFLLIKFVMTELINQFMLASAGGRVGVILFDAAGAYHTLSLGDYTGRANLLQKISQLQLIGREKAADNAVGLAAMRAHFRVNVREPAAKIGYLITMSKSGYQLLVEAEARAAAHEGIQMIAIGIGDAVSTEELNNLQMFEAVDGPVVLTPLLKLGSVAVLNELKADLKKYAAIVRPSGWIFHWKTAFDFIILLHDESGRADQGIKAKDFIQRLFSRHFIGPKNVQAGVITFGAAVNTGTNQQIVLGQDMFLGTLRAQVLRLDLQPTGGPNVQAAFSAMKTMFVNNGRTGYRKVALLLLQGDVVIDSTLEATIQDIQKTGIPVLTVGMGPETKQLDMETLAYNRELAFFQSSWSSLALTPHMDAGLVALSRGEFQAQGTGDILRLPDQCKQPAGILFLIDASDSITSIFEDVKRFTAVLMSGFEMPTTQMGTLGFATTVLSSTIIQLGEFTTYVQLYLNFMQRMKINGSFRTTGTSEAIRSMTSMFQKSSLAEKIGVVLTDGKSDNPTLTKQEAERARAAGIQLIAIGVGSGVVKQELEDITGDPNLVMYFLNSDLTDTAKLQQVQQKICVLTRSGGNCGPGNYRVPSTLTCTPCPIGMYQSISEQLFCTSCPAGKSTSTTGADGLADCVKNCPPGTHIKGSGCEPCAIGQYQPASAQALCIPCPTSAPLTQLVGAKSQTDCIADKCTEKMDLVLVVDCTASIGVRDFSLLKLFLINQLAKFNIGSGLTRISVVRIGTVTTQQDISSLPDGVDADKVRDVILNLKGGSESTNTASAIEMAMKILDSQGRTTPTDIPKVMVVVTDGISQQPFQTRFTAVLAQQKGYMMVAMGLGEKVFMPELNDIAPGRVIVEKDFMKLPSLDISSDICKAAKEYTPSNVNPSDKCSSPMDFVLIMDVSESFPGVTTMKSILIHFVNGLKISSSAVRIGVVAFGKDVTMGTIITDNKVAIILAIGTQRAETGVSGTNTAGALDTALTMLTSSRPQAGKALLVITDGASDDHAATKASAAKVEASGVFAVGVGVGQKAFELELKAIGTTGADSVIMVDNIADLTVDMLKDKLCPENFGCSYTLDVVYIWDITASKVILRNAAQFSAELSKRFADVRASIIEVGLPGDTVRNVTEALTVAASLLEKTGATDTIHNIILITDKPVSAVGDFTQLLAAAGAVKNKGVKITIINAGSSASAAWEPVASGSLAVFSGADFNTILPSWYIQRKICQEPCSSGSEIQANGSCGPCAVGRYRNKAESYSCVLCPAGTTTANTAATSQTQCSVVDKCAVAIDLVFVVDSSDSIGSKNFGLLKAFLWKLTDKFTVGLKDTETRIGIVKIGKDVTEDDVTPLSKSVNELAIRLAIMRLEDGELDTNTADAMAMMTKMFTTEGRDNNKYPHIGVVFTDGKSSNTFQTKRQSAIAHLAGVHVEAVALGSNVFEPEIRAIASDSEDQIFRFDTFEKLLASNMIHNHICEAARKYKPPKEDDKTDHIIGDCKSNMDMVLVIDASQSISPPLFAKMQAFLTIFTSRLDIGLTKIRIGVVAFSDVTHDAQIFRLDQSINHNVVALQGILSQRVNQARPGTNTASGLAKMIEMFGTQGRKGSPFVAVVLTDGVSSNPGATRAQAQVAKDKGIHVVAIGFGTGVFKDELIAIATDPASVKFVTNFDDLTTKQLLDLSCASSFKCTSPMNIVIVWDLENYDSMSRAEKLIVNMEKSFSKAALVSVFVDDVVLPVAVGEAVTKLESMANTAASRVIVILTDKLLSADIKNRLSTAVSAAKQKGVLVSVVDAKTPSNNLQSMATSDKLSFITDKFDDLPYALVIKRSLCNEPCLSGAQRSSTGVCVPCVKDTYRDRTESFRCKSCISGTTTPGPGATSGTQCLVGRCSHPMDIVFVLDASQSISAPQFSLMKAFLINTISSFDIGPTRTRIGMVPYSHNVFFSQVFDLQSSKDRAALVSAVNNLRQELSLYGTNTAKAIEAAKNMLRLQGRPTGGVTHTMVVLTDGISDNTYRTIEESKRAQASYIRVVSLGVGQNVFLNELEQLASDEKSVFIMDTFVKLALERNFIDKICEDTYSCTIPMDVMVFEDQSSAATSDAGFTADLTSFKAQLDTQFSRSSRVFVSFSSVTDLASKVTSVAQPSIDSSNKERTKIFLIVTNGDIDAATTKAAIRALREKGGVVAVISANPAVGSTNLAGLVSNLELLFRNEKFADMPASRYIVRKICIGACTDGFARSLTGSCDPCIIGTYRVATLSHTCVTCPAGKTTQNTGAKAASLCIPNCREGTKTVGNTCIDCPVGTYQPQPFQNTCISCAAKFSTVSTKSTSKADCIIDCGAGTYMSSDGQSCVDCPVNTYQPGRLQTSCINCPTHLTTKTTKSTSLTDCVDACPQPMDVVFLVDSSTSLSTLEFNMIKGFLINTVSRFVVGPTETRFGVISFANKVLLSPLFHLSQSSDGTRVKQAVTSLIQGTSPGTSTAAAFTRAIQMFADEGRAGKPKSIVVITDGISDNMAETVAEASKAKRGFIHVVSVGVGSNYFRPELDAIATDETSLILISSFFSLLNYNLLPDICTDKFTCSQAMNVFYISNYNTGTMDRQVAGFLRKLSDTYSTPATRINSGKNSLTDDLNLLAAQVGKATSSDAAKTHLVFILTNKANTEMSAGVAASALRARGVVVAVVYASDNQTDVSYNNIASNHDLVFYTSQFDKFPYEEYILRSCCISACPSGSERAPDGTCRLCAQGSYRTNSQSLVCVPCPPSHTTLKAGATSRAECTPTPCTAAEYQCATRNECYNKNKRCDGLQDCLDGSDEICNNCAVGTYWDGRQCLPCSQGYYQAEKNQTTCIKCPEGTTTSRTQSTSASDCNVKCDTSGQELQFPGGSCKICLVGFYRDSNLHTVCVPCRAGFTTRVPGATGEDQCVPNCAEGQRWDEASDSCIPCLVKWYQPEKYQLQCIPCPAGTTTTRTGSTNLIHCVDPCPPGKELPASGVVADKCTSCPLSTYKSSSETTCQKCPDGHYTEVVGSTSLSDCKPNCNAGHYLDRTLKQCVMCTWGWYQNVKGQYTCKQCPQGTSTERQGSDSLTDCKVPCTLGKILDPTGRCVPCEIGYYRDDTAEVNCTQCPNGLTTLTVGADSSSLCIPGCQPGTKRVGSACQDCPIGTYQPASRRTTCISCPTGRTTLLPRADRENLCIDICESGFYLVSHDPPVCSPCPADTHRVKNVGGRCEPCPAGFITIVLSGACMPNCSPGERYDTGTKNCVRCPVNTFQHLRYQYSCIPCPGGRVTLATGATRLEDCKFECIAGHRWDDVGLQCVQCGKGFYQANAHQTKCDKCPLGTTTVSVTATRLSECTDPCPSGQELPSGGTTVTDCVDCTLGTYKIRPTHTFCQKCPAGFTTLSVGSKDTSDCKPSCGVGTHWDVNIKQCLPCAKGTYQDLPYQTACKRCVPRGYTTLGSGADSATDCVSPCHEGYQWQTDRCVPCPVNFYQDEPFRATCKPCPSGQVTKTEQSKSIKDCKDPPCNPGEWACDNNQCIPLAQKCDGTPQCADRSDESVGNCASCVAGTFWNSTARSCQNCIVGTYQDQAKKKSCKPCPDGMVTDSPGAASFSKCKECPAGNQFTVGTSGCEACPINTYRASGMTTCERCPAGFITLQIGTKSSLGCKPNCAVGQYFNGSQCVPCVRGSYQENVHQRSCTACPVGLTTRTTGSDEAQDCVDVCGNGQSLVYSPGSSTSTTCHPCPKDTYKTAPHTTCQNCATGFTAPTEGSTRCIPICKPGTYWKNVSVNVCTLCPKGQYQPLYHQSSCRLCVAGKTTRLIGSHSVDQCIDPCPGGYAYNTVSGSCTKCSQGSYRERDVDVTCQACANKYTTEYAGSPNKASCVSDCTSGWYWNLLSQRCEVCPLGTYQPRPYQAKCESCPAGTFTDTTASTDIRSCKDPCPDGQQHYYNGVTRVCEPCPVSQVKVAPGTTCRQCSSGLTTPSVGSTKCVPDCRPGQYWDGTSCTLCKRGTYQALPHQDRCDACPTGLTTLQLGATKRSQCIDFCYSGLELQIDGKCVPCKKNYYRTRNVHGQCVACPPGLVSLFIGTASVKDCLPPCDVGNHWNNASRSCVPCEVGRYQDEKYQYTCKSCNQGKTTVDSTSLAAVTGAKDKSSCVGDCGAGTRWNASLARCQDCPKGMYQTNKYRDFCSQCPLGYTTPSPGSSSASDCKDPCENGKTYNPTTDGCDPCGYNKYRYRPDNNLCVDCDQGLITLTNTAIEESECVPPCAAGTAWQVALKTCVECKIGYYQPNSNQKSCLPCPNGGTTLNTGATATSQCLPSCMEGEYWNKLTLTCDNCATGTYQDQKHQEQCKKCGSGKTTQHERSIKKSDCIASPCTVGQWRCLSGVGCGARCDAIIQCGDSSDEAGCACPAGTFYSFPTATCERCPRGQYQSGTGQTFCVPCPLGYDTAGSGADNIRQCTDQCSNGTVYDSSTSSCSVCPRGTYRAQGDAQKCHSCPTGFTTQTVRTSSVIQCIPDCPAGRYYDVAAGKCEDCAQAYYQDAAHQYRCKKCPAGMTTTKKATVLPSNCYDLCPAGTMLPPTGTNSSHCRACSKGSFKDASISTGCQTCPPGYTTVGTSSSSKSDCIPNCGPGQHVNPAGTGCDQCGRGFWQSLSLQRQCKACPNKTSTLQIGATSVTWCSDVCSSGFELGVDLVTCSPCLKGFYRTRGTHHTCQPCPGGLTTPSIGAPSLAECKPNCPRGSRYVGTLCVPCPVGSYQDLPHQTSCKDCALWKTTSATGSDKFTDCKDKCESGRYTSAGSCVLCPRGTYRQKGVMGTCQRCPTGFTTLATGATTASQCVPDCRPATHWDPVGDRCVPCEQGTYNLDPYQLRCKACPPDKPISEDDRLGCKALCPPGEIWRRPLQRCNWCAANMYKNGLFVCQPCPSGTTSIMGSNSITDCKGACGPGHYFNAATVRCLLCPDGQFQSAARPHNETSCHQCVLGRLARNDRTGCKDNCNVGFYWHIVYGRCMSCPKATYQDERGQEQCKPCPAGRHTKGTGATQEDQCQADWCDPGYYYTLTNHTCIPCGYGKFRRRIEDPKCYDCPSGATTFTNTAGSVGECTARCAPGTYVNPVLRACSACSQVQYQDEWNQFSCKPCPTGLHTRAEGSKAEEDCQAHWCAAGLWYDRSIHTCQPCGTGFYRQKMDKACIKCPDSKTTDSATAGSQAECVDVLPVSCAPGTYIDKATRGCTPCSKAQYQNLANQLFCKDCPSGLHTMGTGATSELQCQADWCEAGYRYNRLVHQCEPCGRDYFRRKIPDPDCIKCPDGSYTISKTAASPFDCIVAKWSCSPGSYINLVTRGCTTCPKAQYQNLANQLFCKDCPTGLHTMGTGATSELQCQADWCEAGYRYNRAFHGCEPCKKGYYRRKIPDPDCIKCPSGFTTLSETAGSKAECIRYACAPGSFIDEAKGVCTLCPVSGYQDEPDQFSCKNCPTDQHTKMPGATSLENCQADWCEGGYLYNRATTQCQPCGYGLYRDKFRDPACLQCPEGTTTATQTAGALADCTVPVCPLGQEPIPGQFRCRLCAQGFYRSNPLHPRCQPCPNQLMTLRQGSTSHLDCQDPCPSGQEFAQGHCVLCAIGQYKTAGLHVMCKDCPYGLSTYQSGSISILSCMRLHCQQPLDLVIVIDMSRSASIVDCNALRVYIRGILREFAIGPDHTRIGIIQYANSAADVIHLRDGTSYQQVLAQVRSRFQVSRHYRVHTGLGLLRARQMLLSDGQLGRSQHVLLITDDPTYPPTLAYSQADLLKVDGVQITVVGVDSRQVTRIASSSRSAFIITSYRDLPSPHTVVRDMCQG